MGVATKVQRSTGGGVTDVYWSPDGGKVFAGCRGALFRVWETLKWSCEKWTNNEGRVKVSVTSVNVTLVECEFVSHRLLVGVLKVTC